MRVFPSQHPLVIILAARGQGPISSLRGEFSILVSGKAEYGGAVGTWRGAQLPPSLCLSATGFLSFLLSFFPGTGHRLDACSSPDRGRRHCGVHQDSSDGPHCQFVLQENEHHRF